VPAGEVAEDDPYADARACLVAQHSLGRSVLGEEQTAVREYADLVFRAREQMSPGVRRHGRSVRVDDAYLVVHRLRVNRLDDGGPDGAERPACEVGQGGAMARVGYAPAQPSLDGLRVDAELCRDVCGVHADAVECACERMLHGGLPGRGTTPA